MSKETAEAIIPYFTFIVILIGVLLYLWGDKVFHTDKSTTLNALSDIYKDILKKDNK